MSFLLQFNHLVQHFPRFSRKAFPSGGIITRCAGLAWARGPLVSCARPERLSASASGMASCYCRAKLTRVRTQGFLPFCPTQFSSRCPRTQAPRCRRRRGRRECRTAPESDDSFLDRSGPSKRGSRRSSGVRAASRGRASARKRFEPVSNASRKRSYLVDPASSHMLVSKIKPCMSKYMPY